MKTYSIDENNVLTCHTTIPGPVFDLMTEGLGFAEKEEFNRLNHGKNTQSALHQIIFLLSIAILITTALIDRSVESYIAVGLLGLGQVIALFHTYKNWKKIHVIWKDIVDKHQAFRYEFFHGFIDYPTLNIDQMVGRIRNQIKREMERGIETSETIQSLSIAKDCLGDKVDVGQGLNFFLPKVNV